MNDPILKSQSVGIIKTWIAGVTGVLIVIPSLINAGIDVYSSLANLPGSASEKVNVDLFNKHIGTNPLHSGKIPVRTDRGSINMEFTVFNGGDIFVRYGQYSQWFRSPLINTASNGYLVSVAHAGSAIPNQKNAYKQFDRIENGEIISERFFPGGAKESYKIDTITGKWSKPEIGLYEQLPNNKIFGVEITKYPEIDLRKK